MSKMKAKLDYTVRTTRAPGETTDTIVPMIVDRLQPTELEAIIEKCIDRGLIAGLKATAAKTIADGVAEQIAKEFQDGNGIQFGQYFYGRLYLDGTVSGNGSLGGDNNINVRLYKGNAFKLERSDFSLNYIDGGNNPKIDYLVSDGDYPRDKVVKGAMVKLFGRMLYGAGDTVKVKFTKAGEEPIVVTSFDSIGAELLTFDCPTTLADNGEYVVTVERTDTNNVTRISKGEKVTALAGATPPVPAPTITAAGTVGDEPGVVNVAGATLAIEGTNLETVTEVQLLTLPAGEVWQTVQVEYDEETGKLLSELDLESPPTSNGAISITTAGGNATFEVTYESH